MTILQQWVALGLKPLLATADCNVAVDNMAAGLSERGVRVVRVGRPEKIGAALEEVSLEAVVGQLK